MSLTYSIRRFTLFLMALFDLGAGKHDELMRSRDSHYFSL